MTFGTTTRALLLSAMLAAPAGLAQAQTQTPAPIKPGEPGISMDDARRIAKEHGLVRVEEIKLDDGKWEIEGRDSTGAGIEIDLRTTDGSVIKMERDRPASAGVRP
ncbi:MAG TPA: PepSY domain-containing protein [Bosea sp. (in: a-proteobacteria)]